MRSNTAFLIPLLLLASFLLVGWSFPDDFTFVGLEKYAQELKKNVFSVQIEGDLQNADKADDYKIVGSGFLITKNNFIIGITCKHVVSKFFKMENGKFLYIKNIFIGLDTNEGFRRFSVDVGYVSGDNDFCLLLPKKERPEEKVILQNLVLNDGYLGNPDLIIEGKGVLIIGYPLGLGVEYDQNFPVSRIGIIAQYTKRNYFLIDAVANLGNSGSPVYSLRDGKIVGMVTSFKTDHIPLFDEDKNLVAALPYNSGLSSALPVDVIKKALDEWLESSNQ